MADDEKTLGDLELSIMSHNILETHGISYSLPVSRLSRSMMTGIREKRGIRVLKEIEALGLTVAP